MPMKNINDPLREDTLLPQGDLAGGERVGSEGPGRPRSPTNKSVILSAPENELTLCTAVQEG